jgi:hypothetical protein
MSDEGICVYMITRADDCPPYSEDLYYAFPCDEEGECAPDVYIPPHDGCPSGAYFVLMQDRCDWATTASDDPASSGPAGVLRSPALWSSDKPPSTTGDLAGREVVRDLIAGNLALDALSNGSSTDDDELLRAIRSLAGSSAAYARWKAGMLLGRWHALARERGLRGAVQRAEVEMGLLGEPTRAVAMAASAAPPAGETSLPLSGMRILDPEERGSFTPFSP